MSALFAKEQNIEEEKALAAGMAEKAKEFVATGGAHLSREFARRWTRASLTF
jgi:hypothetical protein